MASITRSYSIPCDNDNKNVSNGRCPTYALTWTHEANKHHWPIGHDYFMGNGENINDGSREIREILSRRLAGRTLTDKIVFCDLDGVLADFEQGIINKFKKTPDQISPNLMWGAINKSNFFETLPWMPKGRELWSHIRKYNPIILTGIPGRRTSAIEQKIKWCQRELGADIDVVTCLTREKPQYCLPGSILIDDRFDNLNAWNDKGGKFILYDEEYLDAIVEKIDEYMDSNVTLV